MAWGYGWFVVGFLFLWNPHINVIDILPDVIGWFFIAIGLSHLSYLSEEAALARKRAWILCGISLSQLLPMYVSIRGDGAFPLAAEPTMVLTYTFVYGLLYLWLGTSVIFKAVNACDTIATLHGAKAATVGVKPLKVMTVIFFVLRFACSILPECVHLRSTEYLGNVIYGVVYDIRNFRPYLVIFFTGIACIVGLLFLIFAMRYFARIKKDGTFFRVMGTLANERYAEFYANKMNSRFATTQTVFLMGALFFGSFTIDYIEFLPDFMGVLLIFTALLLLSRFVHVPKGAFCFGAVSLVATVVFGIWKTAYASTFSTLPYTFFRLCKYSFNLSHPDVTATLRAEISAQWLVCIVTAFKTVLLILFIGYVVRAIEALDTISAKDGVTVYDSMTKKLMRDERFAYERASIDVRIWFIINACIEILEAMPPFALSITPIYMIRIGVFIVFLCKFSSYLSKKKTMLYYHFTYNTETADE